MTDDDILVYMDRAFSFYERGLAKLRHEACKLIPKEDDTTRATTKDSE